MPFYKNLFHKLKTKIRKGAFTRHPEYSPEESEAGKKAYEVVKKYMPSILGMSSSGMGVRKVGKVFPKVAMKVWRKLGGKTEIPFIGKLPKGLSGKKAREIIKGLEREARRRDFWKSWEKEMATKIKKMKK